jgi:hypothetical protein
VCPRSLSRATSPSNSSKSRSSPIRFQRTRWIVRKPFAEASSASRTSPHPCDFAAWAKTEKKRLERSPAPARRARGFLTSGGGSWTLTQAQERAMARVDHVQAAFTVRCAIYARKSSDEGLDQEFPGLRGLYREPTSCRMGRACEHVPQSGTARSTVSKLY